MIGFIINSIAPEESNHSSLEMLYFVAEAEDNQALRVYLSL